jgi:glycosyltransferase involved in cell wall biosynthesis
MAVAVLGQSAAFASDGVDRWSLPRGPLPAPPNIFVVPAYNEQDNITRLLVDLEARPDLFPAGSRVIVVDDGSEDETAQIVENYPGSLPVELLRLVRNQGPGGAFRAGFTAALDGAPEDALVVTLEADTTSDLDALPQMLERAVAGAELVLASVHGGGRMVNVGPCRRLLSRGAGYVVRRALGIDAQTVSSFFRVYRSSALRAGLRSYGDGLIQETGFACKAELLAKLVAIGARVEEVPVDLDAARRVGKSKMPVLQTVAGYGRLCVRRRFVIDRSAA